MSKQSKKNQNRRVSLEIERSDLSLVIVENSNDATTVRGFHRTWLEEARSLSDTEAIGELAETIEQLVHQEKLSGTRVNITLSSDFCVTRVLAGENDRVGSELRGLNDRSKHYLMLGAGQKAVAESTLPIDARQTQAWLSVTNRRTVDHVVRAVTQAGLQVDLIEHDMVAVCRAVGKMQVDDQAPVIIVEINPRSVVLAVSYKGQLLFDYRPGGIDSKERIAETVQRHRERIQRYCNRQFRFASGQITKVYLCGAKVEVDPVLAQFAASSDELTAEVLNAKNVGPDWIYDPPLPEDVSFVAAMGSALVGAERLGAAASGRGMPNLMDFFRSANREPLWPTLIRVAWPIAAAILLAVGIYGMAMFGNSKASSLEGMLAKFDSETGHIRNIQLETEVINTKLGHLNKVRQGISNPAWNELLAMIGQSMPDNVWLDSLRVDHDGGVSITGPGATEDLIYEFVRYLKQIPVLEQVNLEGQQPIRLPQGPAIKFDIKCKFNDQRNLIERTASND